jgi:hypothetical protein
MGLLADNFVLTHISLKCLFTKKWKIEREKDKETGPVPGFRLLKSILILAAHL